MRFSRNVVVVAIAVTCAVSVVAHEMTVTGTVAAIEATRIQVKTGHEKSGEAPAWYPIDANTQIKRGTKTVKFDEAKITVDERVAVLVDHPDKGPMKTREIRLAAR